MHTEIRAASQSDLLMIRCGVMDMIDDQQARHRLMGISDDLSALAEQCWSPRAAMLIRWAAMVIGRVAAAMHHAK